MHGVGSWYSLELLCCDSTSRPLRSRKNVPRSRLVGKGDCVFSTAAHKLWISLPPPIKHSSSTDICKNNLKAHLFSKPFCCSWWCSYISILYLFPFRETSCKLFSILHLLILQVLPCFLSCFSPCISAVACLTTCTSLQSTRAVLKHALWINLL